MDWQDTKTKNKYGTHNKMIWVGNIRCVVFRRRYGWSFTSIATLYNGLLLEIAAPSQKYYASVEVAQMQALAAVEDLNLMTEPVQEEAL